jgi:hypothetical protein
MFLDKGKGAKFIASAAIRESGTIIAHAVLGWLFYYKRVFTCYGVSATRIPV